MPLVARPMVSGSGCTTRRPTTRRRHGRDQRHYGDDVLNAFIEQYQPDLVLAGHVHESPFRPDGSWHDRIGDTVVLNAGRQLGQIPAHIIIDTGSGRLDWWSVEAEESIAL